MRWQIALREPAFKESAIAVACILRAAAVTLALILIALAALAYLAAKATVTLVSRIPPKRALWAGLVLSWLLGVLPASTPWPVDFLFGLTCATALAVLHLRDLARRLGQQREWRESRGRIRDALAEEAETVLASGDRVDANTQRIEALEIRSDELFCLMRQALEASGIRLPEPEPDTKPLLQLVGGRRKGRAG